MKFSAFAAAAVLALAGAAQAQVVFSDDFETSAAGSNLTPTSSTWQVLAGATVDTLGTGYYGNLCDTAAGGGSGNQCVDMEGTILSALPSFLLKVDLPLTIGATYTASFQVAGSQRGTTESFVASFGGATTGSVSVVSNALFTTYTLTSVAVAPSTILSFANLTNGDNIGVLVDNISVQAVPEPETYALLAAGLGVIGFMARRRAQR